MFIAQNAGKVKVVFSDFQVQPSAEIVRVDRAECQERYAFVIRKGVFYEWSYIQDSDAENLTLTSCASVPMRRS